MYKYLQNLQRAIYCDRLTLNKEAIVEKYLEFLLKVSCYFSDKIPANVKIFIYILNDKLIDILKMTKVVISIDFTYSLMFFILLMLI